MNLELEEEMKAIVGEHLTVKRSDYDELVRRLHEAERKLLEIKDPTLGSILTLKPKRITMELDYDEP